jgi:hypothetical protein
MIVETQNFGMAAWASEIKGLLVHEFPFARGRANFEIHLDNGDEEQDVLNEWLNSDYYRFDTRVRQLKSATYLKGKRVNA